MPKVTNSQFNTNISATISMPYAAWVRLMHLVNMKGHHNWESYRNKQARMGYNYAQITDKISAHSVADAACNGVFAAASAAGITLNPEVVPDEQPIVVAGHRVEVGSSGVQVGCTNVPWDVIRKLAEKDPARR